MREQLKEMFPDYHPEEHEFSIASCCGSCLWGEAETFCVLCHRRSGNIQMFSYGYCPQYERNKGIKMPVVMGWIKNNQFGNGQG